VKIRRLASPTAAEKGEKVRIMNESKINNQKARNVRRVRGEKRQISNQQFLQSTIFSDNRVPMPEGQPEG
jgi:hypothetical protein